MAKINSTVSITDRASSVFRRIGKSVKTSKMEIVALRQEAGKKPKTPGLFEGLSGKVIALNQGLELARKGFEALGKVAAFSDQLTTNKIRIDLINDGLQTTAELQEMIYQSANRSRGSYDAMQKTVAKLGLLAKDAFTDNKELVAFTETLNKAFVVSGATPDEQGAAMYQLTQAMASGRLQGDEYVSIIENAPMLAQAIADTTGVGMKGLKDLSSEGAITSDIIKTSLFEAAENIEEMFQAMPMTFAQASQRAKNAFARGMEGVADRISALLNSDEWRDKFNQLIVFLENLGTYLMPIIEGIITIFSTAVSILSTFFSWVRDNWGVISSILITGLILLAAYWVVVGTQAAIAGVKMFLATLPTLWPLYLILGIIVLLIVIARKLGVSWEQVFGFILSTTFLVIAGIWNIFLALFDFILIGVNLIGRKFASFANFLSNVFQDPVAAVVYLMRDMANSVLSILNSLAKAMDKLFGTNLSKGVTKWMSNVDDLADKIANKHGNGKYKQTVEWEDLSSDSFGLKRMEYESSWNKGKDMGESIGAGLDNITSIFDGFDDLLAGTDTGKYNFDDFYNNGSLDTNVTGGKLDEVNISDEDLKMLKDLANKEYMINYKQITPNIHIEFGDVRETADVDEVSEKLRRMMENELAELYVVEEA